MSRVAFDFAKENFIVVGASSGMGRQIALDLAEAGARVLAIARNEERLESLRQKYSDKIETASLDVISATDDVWNKAVGGFVAKNGKLSGGVYTAGIVGPTPLKMFDENLARNIISTGLTGMMNFLHCAVKKRYAHKGASYVVFSSTGAYSGQRGCWAYSGTKAAVQAAMKSVAKEIGKDAYRINSVSPGFVKTEMTENYQETVASAEGIVSGQVLGIGQPSYVSRMVLFLLSDDAKWITGTDVVVDGGGLLGTF